MGIFKAWLREVTVDCPNGIFAKVLPVTDSVIAIRNRFAHYPGLLEDLHATLIYSKTPAQSVDLPMIERDSRYSAVGNALDWWEGHDKEGYLVLRLESPDLQAAHRLFTDAGLTATFPDYKPHVSLLTPCPAKPADFDYQNLILRQSPLNLQFYYGGYVLLDPKPTDN